MKTAGKAADRVIATLLPQNCKHKRNGLRIPAEEAFVPCCKAVDRYHQQPIKMGTGLTGNAAYTSSAAIAQDLVAPLKSELEAELTVLMI